LASISIGKRFSFAFLKVKVMDNHQLTTPFGRRGVNYAHFAKQIAARDIKPNITTDKWKLFRMLCEAKTLIGVSDRSLAVLNALLSFYPKTELTEREGLIVFPSNEQIALRAHGMPEQTLRRHLAALVDAGLILRKDSPNGKRYARKDKSGAIRDAFGFSLAPLLARYDEFAEMVETVHAERLLLQSLKDQYSLLRRNIITFIITSKETGIESDWNDIESRFHSAMEGVSRSPKVAELQKVIASLEPISLDLSKTLENNNKTENLSGNDCQIERQIKTSESESQLKELYKNSDLIFDSKQSNTAVKATPSQAIEHQPVSLPMVLKACPDIHHYGPSGTVRGWSDLKYACSVVMKMFSIPLPLYAKASVVMGEQVALAVIAYILQKGGQIESAGGYLQSLIKKAAEGAFSLDPLLMALLRRPMLN
jgi:replication initiation protein RepC